MGFVLEKKNCFGKRAIGCNDEFSHLTYVCMRESVMTRDMGMISHISFIACRISCIDLHVLLGMCVLLCEHDIAYALRWGVTLVGVYSIGFFSPRRGTPFQVVQATDPYPRPQA